MIKRELEACLEVSVSDKPFSSYKCQRIVKMNERQLLIQEKRKLEEKIETLEFKLQEKERTIEELDEKNRSEKSKFQQERKQHTQVGAKGDFIQNLVQGIHYIHDASFLHTQVVVELQSRIDELKSFKKDAESRLPDFVNVAAEKGDLEDQLRALQKVQLLLLFLLQFTLLLVVSRVEKIYVYVFLLNLLLCLQLIVLPNLLLLCMQLYVLPNLLLLCLQLFVLQSCRTCYCACC